MTKIDLSSEVYIKEEKSKEELIMNSKQNDKGNNNLLIIK